MSGLMPVGMVGDGEWDSCYLDSMAAGEMVRAVHSVVRGMGRFDIRVD